MNPSLDPKPPLPKIDENTNLLVLLIDSRRRVQKLIMPESMDSPEPLDDVAGKPPGEVLCCCNAEDYPEGCGNTPACEQCEINRAIREAMERHTACHRRKAHLNKQSGETRFANTIYVSAMCIDNGENQADSRILMCVEETHQLQQAVKERKKLEERLRHTQKLEAVGKLSGGIAHEFNNLLQIINGYADLMADELEQDHPTRAYLNEISAAGSRAADMVRHLLAFSRKQVMQMRDVEINGLIEKTLSMLRSLIGEKIEIDYIPGRHVGRVRVDAAHIQQVLLNLCLNAKDAMPEGGTVTIETENVLINGQYCRTHDWAEPGRFALISVTDAGCGIDAQTTARIFEPFFTTKPREKNNGLGLSTAYGIICQHQGMINVYSEPGRGTMFKIYLPVTERRATEVEVNLQGRVKGGTETILVAEDDEMVCDLMQTVLSRAGYKVFCAGDGETAIELFAQNRDKIDMAVLDVVMPAKDGRQVYEAIKEFNPDIQVLFSSGYSENAIHTNFVLHEGMQLLQKPFTTDELLRKVRALLDTGSPSQKVH
ncbi:MAG: response regulator [Desulfosalsimonas sp.]|uniref:ATP-binding protein n=1 Tax=Desulfosalsimonas sp. TaxID=3073848 RepID=UPI00397061BA